MTPHLLSTMRELHSRVTHGLHVRLLWSAYAAWRGVETGLAAA